MVDRIDIATAVEIADAADLPDGAWWAYVESLTGLDAGRVCSWLEQHQNAGYVTKKTGGSKP
jgi:hypothetical protein